jgi:hypothetical protein
MDSDDAWVDSVDLSLVHLGERLNEVQRRSCGQFETVYNHAEMPACCTFVSDKRYLKVTAEAFPDKFGISVPRAQRTLRVTTQRGVQSAILPIKIPDQLYVLSRLSLLGGLDPNGTTLTSSG